MDSSFISNIINVTSGIAWTFVYISLFCLGLKYKTYGIPFLALCLNFFWEFVYGPYTLLFTDIGFTIPSIITTVWFVLDIGVLTTFFLYGRKFFPQYFSKGVFVGWSILGLAMGCCVQFLFFFEFEGFEVDGLASDYSGSIQSLIMGIMFIYMLFRRENTEGQSIWIAGAMFIGSSPVVLWFGYIQKDPFFIGFGILITIFNFLYLVLLWLKLQGKIPNLGSTSSE